MGDEHLLFVADGGMVSEGRLQPHGVVEAFDEGGHGHAGPGLRGEAPTIQQLALEDGDEALAYGVILSLID